VTPSFEQRHYNHAPIVEAVLGFRTSSINAERLDALQAVGHRLIADYPIVATLSNAKSSEVSTSPIGYSFTSTNGKQIVKAGLNSFSFHRLEPYDCWETFISEARRTADAYFEIVPPVAVTALWVRYINVLKIPFYVPLHHFFAVYPAMPNPDVLFTKIFMHVETEIEELPGSLAVRFTPTAESDEEHFRMLLDNTFTFNIRDRNTAWDNLDLIRRIKNSTFESQLRDELKETLA
jgi:uncharacterized protein (TIGR04255 family)